MRKIIIFFLPLIFISCVTIEIPEQIKEEFFYEKNVNASFEDSINATAKALGDLRWKVSDISRSMLTEKDKSYDKRSTRLAFIFTELKQVYLFLTSSYSICNARIETIDDSHTQIAVRYLSVTPIPPFYNKKFTYRNDKLAQKIFSRIDAYLYK